MSSTLNLTKLDKKDRKEVFKTILNSKYGVYFQRHAILDTKFINLNHDDDIIILFENE